MIFHRFKNWFEGLGREGARPSLIPSYRVFTTEFDKVILAENLDDFAQSPAKLNDYLTADNQQDWLDDCETYANNAESWKQAALTRQCAGQGAQDTTISIVVDHSGSMRGKPSMVARAATEILSETFIGAGATVEILGFTTGSWKGGNALKKWLKHGRPFYPGRLCDLLHIIYRDADSTLEAAPATLHNFHRREVLRENIDGEALVWAAQRIASRPERRKIIVMVSDGAQVDDSTLYHNTPDILERHLVGVIKELQKDGEIELVGVGISYDVGRYYPNCVVLENMQSLGDGFADFCDKLILGKFGEAEGQN